jgi:hypothetical protein
MKSKTTTILCKTDGKFHTLTLTSDTAKSSSCGDITDAAKRVAATISLGKALMEDNCTGLAALLLHGIPTAFKQPPMGEYIQWGAWGALYTRFESNKLVVALVSSEQRAKRLREREAKKASVGSLITENIDDHVVTHEVVGTSPNGNTILKMVSVK